MSGFFDELMSLIVFIISILWISAMTFGVPALFIVAAWKVVFG